MTDETEAETKLDPDVLAHSLDALGEQWAQVADSLRELTDVYQRDRKFRRWVTAALVAFTLAGLIIGGVAISTALRLQEQVDRSDRAAQEQREADKMESCLRGNVLRQDIYVGVDAVLDKIAPATDDDGRQVIAAAKAEVRRKIPLRDCG